MFAVLGEHRSDAETLVVIIKRLLGDDRASILRKGFNGCGELCRKGASHIRQFGDRGATHFVVCHDADGPDPAPVLSKVREMIVDPAHVAATCCIVVPVQELEAWIIADEAAIAKTIPSLKLKPLPQPESRSDPKEWLVRQSRKRRSRPLFTPTMHNRRVAEHLDLKTVADKCPSFRPLVDFVRAV